MYAIYVTGASQSRRTYGDTSAMCTSKHPQVLVTGTNTRVCVGANGHLDATFVGSDLASKQTWIVTVASNTSQIETQTRY